jgi:hypothetical protein
MRIAAILLLTSLICGNLTPPTAVSAAQPPGVMIKLKLDGQWIEGQPLDWSKDRVDLLGCDGQLWQLDQGRATDFSKTADRFQPVAPSQLRATLLRELGGNFEVSGTSHYMVAHKAGQRDKWAPRFEELYRSFVHYFSVRGFKPRKPAFPLVGIVCRNRSELHRYTTARGLAAPVDLLGYYELKSNRIALYDMAQRATDRQGGGDSDTWQENAAVIIHEATHQTAFNTGIHSRVTRPPLWVAEGLATMFEEPGLYDSRNHANREDRINQGRLDVFRQSVATGRHEGLIRATVASDELFRSNPAPAYAGAWALTFYLAETQPLKYTKYLALTAQKRSSADYTGPQRLGDFTSIFGNDWRMLEARLSRFMSGL